MSAAAAEALQHNPNVSFVEQDQAVAAIGSESLPGGEPWGLDRIDQTSLPFNNTYNYTDTGSGVVAYIIDTGIRTSHTEFGGERRADSARLPMPTERTIATGTVRTSPVLWVAAHTV